VQKTKIEWVKNPDGTQGYTFNPITGCLNGCEYCYARKLANRWLKKRYLANHRWSTEVIEHRNPAAFDPFYPRFWPEKAYELSELMRVGRRNPRGIFVCSMSDLFGIGVPERWTEDILYEIKKADIHRFYLLTKQPQNLIKFSPFPDNAWVGQTITSQQSYWKYWDEFALTKAKIKFISFEPLLESVKFDSLHLKDSGIKWVIIGAQTNPTVMPKIEWVNEIVEAADKAGIPVFLKDSLNPLAELIAKFCGKETWELRQEMPV